MPTSIDFETYLISNEQPNPKPVCLSEYSYGKTPELHVGHLQMECALRRILQEDQIVAHNAMFELLVTYTHFPNLRKLLWKSLEEGRWFCTQLYQQLLDNVSKKELKPHTLANLVKVYFEEDISEDKKNPDAWRLRYNELDGVPLEEWPQEAIDYAIDDSIWALKIQTSQLKLADLDFKDQVYDGFCLNLMASFGIMVDIDRVSQLEEECWEKIIPPYRILNRHGLVKLNQKFKISGEPYETKPSVFRKLPEFKRDLKLKYKNKDLKGETVRHKFTEEELKYRQSQIEYFTKEQDRIFENWKVNSEVYQPGKFLAEIQKYIEDNFETRIKTNTGKIATGDEALASYLGENPKDPVVKALTEIGKYEKALTAFVARLKQADPVIRSTYNPIVSSGRTSARASTAYPSVNIQQMPRGLEGVTWDVRNCFVPRKGFLICSIDYNGLELSSAAHQLYKARAGSSMRKTVNSGDGPVDMHSKLACRIKSMKEKRKCTYEEFVANKKKPGYKEFRQLSKPINLGFPGGIGYDTMRELLAKEGIYPKFKIIQKSKWEEDIDESVKRFRLEGYPVRKKQLGRFEYALVYDELVELKNELFSLYPDLKKFLTKKHEEFLTGETRAKKNEFGMWESDDMYAFNVLGVRRDWCTYTALCNGFLMQTPSAIGAKLAVRNTVKKYLDDDRVNMLSFIHDEQNCEIRADADIEKLVLEQCEIMIDSMQSILTSVRIAVEAQTMTYWAKDGNLDTWTAWKNPGDSKLYWRRD